MCADSGLGLEELVLRVVGCSSILLYAVIWSVKCSDMPLPRRAERVRKRWVNVSCH